MPDCCGAGHYLGLCCAELYCQYGFEKIVTDDGNWNHSALEMCCPTCRLRRTPCFAPCFKFETTCTLVDFKCVIPCDRDQPLEIGVCGWNCYTKREKVNTTGNVFLQIKSIKVQ